MLVAILEFPFLPVKSLHLTVGNNTEHLTVGNNTDQPTNLISGFKKCSYVYTSDLSRLRMLSFYLRVNVKTHLSCLVQVCFLLDLSYFDY